MQTQHHRKQQFQLFRGVFQYTRRCSGILSIGVAGTGIRNKRHDPNVSATLDQGYIVIFIKQDFSVLAQAVSCANTRDLSLLPGT